MDQVPGRAKPPTWPLGGAEGSHLGWTHGAGHMQGGLRSRVDLHLGWLASGPARAQSKASRTRVLKRKNNGRYSSAREVWSPSTRTGEGKKPDRSRRSCPFCGTNEGWRHRGHLPARRGTHQIPHTGRLSHGVASAYAGSMCVCRQLGLAYGPLCLC